MLYTPADLHRAQRRVEDGERRLAKQRDMLAKYCRLGFPMEEAVETLARALYRLDQMRRHREEIGRHVKPDHSSN